VRKTHDPSCDLRYPKYCVVVLASQPSEPRRVLIVRAPKRPQGQWQLRDASTKVLFGLAEPHPYSGTAGMFYPVSQRT